ncbi:YcjF family protein [Vibrio tritonius]|uniref:YcjF family protein n=1 Tax=Vibrio tritonius TaxID=1435069 RepID=A0ABS7YL62_9VIBR|nr:TIGR01620 family protein [Vibrio tritonius]MCA2016403.1 YcjF family protein [Vibrio tritonius]
MSEYKGKAIFKEPLHNDTQQQLTAKQAFQDNQQFIAVTPEEVADEPEVELEEVIRPKSGRLWKVTALLTGFTGLVAWQAVDSVVTSFNQGDWLSLGWTGFISLIAAGGIGALGREVIKLKRLKNHFSVQEQAEVIINENRVGEGESFCRAIAAAGQVSEKSAGFSRWQNTLNSSHSDAEVIELYDAMVVAEQDQKALSIVTRYATEAATLVAVSPLAMADMLLVGWRSLRMVDQLAHLYGVELGYWSRLKLFKAVLMNMAAAGASEMVMDAGMDLMSMDLAAKVSARAGQGIGVGILTARLGIKSMTLLRPLPWAESRRVKLGEVRKHILTKIAALSVK